MTDRERAVSTVIELAAVSKQYGALRPLRIEHLTVAEGEQVALLGLDQPAAEVFVNLITGASLPDSGSVRVFGRDTAEIRDAADWLSTLDRFGIVSDRGALLDTFSVTQNLAVPFSLEIEPPTDEIRQQAQALAREAGLPEETWERRAADLGSALRLRVRLARALAFNPSVLILEHPSATVERDAIGSLARDIRQITERRGAAAISLTMDRQFAEAATSRILTLEPATGRLSAGRFGRIKLWS